MSQNPLQPPQNIGAIRELAQRTRLVWRLLRDQRVPGLLKLLPLGSLIYLIWPIDAVPGVALPLIGALDDAAILWLGVNLFVELCPPDVVEEHKQALGLLPPKEDDPKVIEGKVRDVEDHKK